MESPVDQRLAAVAGSPSGHLAPSGVQAYRNALDGNASAFADWRRHPMTKKLLGAMQDIVLHSPAELATEDRLVQYGVTSGLTLALQLVADPSSVWPGVFGKNTNEQTRVEMPMMDFSTTLDDMID